MAMVKVSFLLLFCTLEYVYGKGRGTGSRSSKPINFKFETTRRYSEIYEGNDVELRCWSRIPWTSCTIAQGSKTCTVNKSDNDPKCGDKGLKWTGAPSLGDSSVCLISILNSTRSLDDNGKWTCNLTQLIGSSQGIKTMTINLKYQYPKFAITYINSTLPTEDGNDGTRIHQNIEVTCRTNYPWKRCELSHNGVNCTKSIDDEQSCSGTNMEWIESSNPYQCQAMIKEYTSTETWMCRAEGKSSGDQDEKESNGGFIFKPSILLTCILSYMILV